SHRVSNIISCLSCPRYVTSQVEPGVLGRTVTLCTSEKSSGVLQTLSRHCHDTMTMDADKVTHLDCSVKWRRPGDGSTRSLS
ncbi:hypothetical protein LSAT2_026887, partial [Lamellibrachia satsuma]